MIWSLLWNQGLVNISFDDNKIRFVTNIIFQVWLGKKISKVAITKTKSSQREINKKKKIIRAKICALMTYNQYDLCSKRHSNHTTWPKSMLRP